MKHEKVTTSAKRILRRRLYDGKPQRIAEREQTRREMCLGMKIQRRREEAGLTQKQLADRIGTQPSAISRVEGADYDSHSLSTLRKIADALDMRLIVDLEEKHGPSRAAVKMI